MKPLFDCTYSTVQQLEELGSRIDLNKTRLFAEDDEVIHLTAGVCAAGESPVLVSVMRVEGKEVLVQIVGQPSSRFWVGYESLLFSEECPELKFIDYSEVQN